VFERRAVAVDEDSELGSVERQDVELYIRPVRHVIIIIDNVVRIVRHVRTERILFLNVSYFGVSFVCERYPVIFVVILLLLHCIITAL